MFVSFPGSWRLTWKILKLTLLFLPAHWLISAVFHTEQSFLTLSDCLAAGNDQDLCQATYDIALAEHRRGTRRFLSKEECESKLDVSRCVLTNVRRWDGRWGGELADMFVPEMAGYMIRYHRDWGNNRGNNKHRGPFWPQTDEGYAVKGYYHQSDEYVYSSGPIHLSRDCQSFKRSTQIALPGEPDAGQESQLRFPNPVESSVRFFDLLAIRPTLKPVGSVSRTCPGDRIG